jgi:predicted transcriptional regulator
VSEPIKVAEQGDPIEYVQSKAPEADEQQSEELSPEALRKQLEKARKEAAGYRTKLRELEPIAAKAKELEDAQKSEAQKLTDRAELAERAAADAQREMARLRVLSEINLPADLHEFVTGDTEDEVRAKAKKLQAQFTAERNAVDVGLGPRRTGNSSAGPADELAAILRSQLGT